MIDVYLLTGSNLGNRENYLRKAVELIENGVAPVIKTSSVYETQSWGKTDEPDYLNQVLYLKTDLAAQNLLEKLLQIELLMGRERKEKWGSRTIDIDILFYGQEVIDEENLHIPHPQLHKRMFTLAPLAEIAPQLMHPVEKKHISQLKSELKDGLIVKKL